MEPPATPEMRGKEEMVSEWSPSSLLRQDLPTSLGRDELPGGKPSLWGNGACNTRLAHSLSSTTPSPSGGCGAVSPRGNASGLLRGSDSSPLSSSHCAWGAGLRGSLGISDLDEEEGWGARQ